MTQRSRAISVVLLAAIVAVSFAATKRMAAVEGAPGGWAGRQDGRAAQLRAPGVQEATFNFDPAITVIDRKAITDAVAAARPEAKRLIDMVDGLTTVHISPLEDGTAGTTQPTQQGYDVVLDLGGVHQRYGQRGVKRLVLHEMAHVVDDALLTDQMRTAFDAGIPPGWPCDPGIPEGSCAPVYERFAESFAKWATGDIGVDLYLGYKVPPPALEEWGAPLAEVGV